MTAVATPAGTIYPLVDEILDGKLAERLIDLRAEGVSFYKIRDELRDRGVAVSHETVRRWCLTLGAS